MTIVSSKPLADMNRDSVSISNGVSVKQVTLSNDRRTASVSTSDLSYGEAYAVTFTNVTDASQSANGLVIDGSVSVTALPPVTIADLNTTGAATYEIDRFAIGTRLYVDHHESKKVPEDYLGLPMIRTAMDDKTLPLGSHSMTFTVNRPVRVRIMASTQVLGPGFDGYRAENTERWGLKGKYDVSVFRTRLPRAGHDHVANPLKGKKAQRMYFLLIEPLASVPDDD